MRSRFAAVALALVACLGFCPPALAQMSDAVHHDRVVTGRAGAGAKFLERKALPDAHDDEEATRPRDHCPANLRLRWMTEVSSSVYSTSASRIAPTIASSSRTVSGSCSSA